MSYLGVQLSLDIFVSCLGFLFRRGKAVCARGQGLGWLCWGGSLAAELYEEMGFVRASLVLSSSSSAVGDIFFIKHVAMHIAL